jgi:hypothetical protein
MNTLREPLSPAFDPAAFVPEEVGEIANHQTDLPRIAKDAKLVAAIEAKLEQLPTRHDLYRGDSRRIDFLRPESVHLVEIGATAALISNGCEPSRRAHTLIFARPSSHQQH